LAERALAGILQFPSHTPPSLTKAARLISLLLGRLGLSASDALDLYGELAKDVFGQKKRYLREGAFDPSHLEQAVKRCITKALGNGHEEDTMLDPKDGQGACKR
jgi:hypothetical protein